jgi:hypothetical protein
VDKSFWTIPVASDNSSTFRGGSSSAAPADVSADMRGKRDSAAASARDVIKDDFGGKLPSDVLFIRTSARIRVYPTDAVLSADGFLPSTEAVKTASARTRQRWAASARTRKNL